MPAKSLETDYLVVGCGAAGMAFTDALISDCDGEVVMIDRRHAPGGHWNDAYPFVRLHQPSSYYGVNSLSLGSDAIDRHGPNQGFYERATAPEICGYFDRVMQQRLLPSGKVRYFPMCEYRGEGRFVSRVSGAEYAVKVRKKLVDATYLEPAVPATYAPPFEVASGVACVSVGELARMRERPERYVIHGAGKTAADTCVWLLELGVAPEDLTWVKPREAWYLNRAFSQGGELVGTLFEGIARQLECAAHASSIDDLFARLHASEQLLCIDASIRPTMFKGATISAAEIEQLRRIRDVVRLGHVRRIERDAIVLDGGTIATSARTLHVHCAAPGLNPAPAVPIFAAERITLQPIRTGLIPFNAAMVGYLEATRADGAEGLAEKNRLCPVNRLPDSANDWLRATLTAMKADYLWSKDAAISAWLERARLNPSRGLRSRVDDPRVLAAFQRYAQHVREGLANLQRLAQNAPD